MINDPLQPIFGNTGQQLVARNELVFSRGPRDRFPEFMYKGLLESIESLCKDYSGNLEVAGGTAGGGIQTSVSGVHPTALLKLGLTVFFPELGKNLPESQKWLRGLEKSLGLPECAVVMAFANAASSGLSLHHDRYDHFFFQIHGHKRFRYAPNRYVTNPDVQYSPIAPAQFQFGQTYQSGFPSSAEDILSQPTETLELGPGDAFFMPAGTWHTTSDQPSESLSVVIAVRAPSYLDILERYIRYYAGQSADWRARAYGGWADHSGPTSAVHENFASLMADLGARFQKLPVADAFSTWVVHAPLVDIRARYGTGDRFDRYIRSPGATLNFEQAREGGDIHCVIKSGPTNRLQARFVIAVGEEARAIVKRIAEKSSAFHVSSLCEEFAEFDREDIEDLLSSLARAGFLRPIPVPEWV